MPNATANSGSESAGSESALPASLTLEEATKIDFGEPDDEANDEAMSAGPEADEDADTSDETDDNLDFADQDEDEGDEPNADEDEANEADENATVTVKGEKLTVKELSLGYLREKDYRHKTAELGAKSRNLEATTARVVNTVDTIANYLAQQLPEEPHPSLAIQNPTEYTRQKAIFEMGLGQIQSILNMAIQPKEIGENLSREDLEQKLSTENAFLIEAFPELEKSEVRDKFFADAFKAGEELGFTPEEMQDFNDHRYFKVMHWALKGLQADRAKKKAMAKMENAPPITPKGKPAGKTTATTRASQDAMKRLNKSGSIKDAMSVDFE